jgi:hypothetical protein
VRKLRQLCGQLRLLKKSNKFPGSGRESRPGTGDVAAGPSRFEDRSDGLPRLSASDSAQPGPIRPGERVEEVAKSRARGSGDGGAPLEILVGPQSPHKSSRRGKKPVCTIIHYTAGASAKSSVDWFADPRARASAHFVIGRDGRVWRCVKLTEAAWHAGRAESPWGRDVNRHSIGIELANWGNKKGEFEPFPEAQLVALEQLLERLKSWGYGEAASNLLGHNEVSPGRKIDPGPLFPWGRFR